jgi:hypothetical protein
MTEKTHYRKAFNSPYLSSADIVESTQLTIARVTLEKDHTKKTQDLFNTAHFVERELRQGEPLKPMILNATNSKTLKTITGSPYIDDWINVPVTVWVDSAVRFGRDTVEGLRLSKAERPDPPTADQLAIIEDFRSEGLIKPETEEWLNDHQLTRKTAERLIKSLSKAA